MADAAYSFIIDSGQIALRSMAFTLAGTTGGRVTGAGPRK